MKLKILYKACGPVFGACTLIATDFGLYFFDWLRSTDFGIITFITSSFLAIYFYLNPKETKQANDNSQHIKDSLSELRRITGITEHISALLFNNLEQSDGKRTEVNILAQLLPMANSFIKIKECLRENNIPLKEALDLHDLAYNSFVKGDLLSAEKSLEMAKELILNHKTSLMPNLEKNIAAASDCALRAKIVKLQGDKKSFSLAASSFWDAYELSCDADQEAARKYFYEYIWTLLELYEKFNDDGSLQVAKKSIISCLDNLEHNRPIVFFGELKLLLGTAFSMEGELKSSNEQLELATDQFKDALLVIQKQDHPKLWGSLQNNLAIALLHIGERRLDKSILHHSISAFTKGLSAYDFLEHKDKPGIYINLGNAFFALGNLTASESFFLKAMQYQKEALKYSAEEYPHFYYSARLNLGETLRFLGELRGERKYLKAAIRFLHMALKGINTKLQPSIWARFQNNISIALQALGRLDSDYKFIHQAYELSCSAIKFVPEQSSPFVWAMLQHTKGNAALLLSEQKHELDFINISISAFSAGLAKIDINDNPLYWGYFQLGLGDAYRRLAALQNDHSIFIKSIYYITHSFLVYSKQTTPNLWAKSCNDLGILYKNWGINNTHAPSLIEAIHHFKNALTIFDPVISPIDWEITQKNISETLMNYAGITNQFDALNEAIREYKKLLNMIKTDQMLKEKKSIMHNLGYCLLVAGCASHSLAMLQEAEIIFTSVLKSWTEESGHPYRDVALANFNDTRAALARMEGLKINP